MCALIVELLTALGKCIVSVHNVFNVFLIKSFFYHLPHFQDRYNILIFHLSLANLTANTDISIILRIGLWIGSTYK